MHRPPGKCNIKLYKVWYARLFTTIILFVAQSELLDFVQFSTNVSRRETSLLQKQYCMLYQQYITLIVLLKPKHQAMTSCSLLITTQSHVVDWWTMVIQSYQLVSEVGVFNHRP